MKRLLIYMLPAVMFLLVGCNADELEVKNLEGPTLRTGVAVPIGGISYTMRELIDDINDSGLDLQEDSTSLYFLVYRDTARFNSGSEIVNIQDISNSDTLNLTGTPTALAPQVVTLDTTIRMSYAADNGEVLDEVFYKAGNVSFTIGNNISDPGVSVSYTASLNGTKLASNDNPMVFTDAGANTQSLVGYYTEFIHSGDSNVFNLDLQLEIAINTGSNIPPGSHISINVLYADQEFSLLRGNFGNDVLKVGNEVLDVAFFEDFNDDAIEFGEPSLSFDFRNSFGIPMEVDFGGLYGLKKENANDTTFLDGPILDNPPVINSPAVEGDTETTVVVLDNTNSNLTTLLGTAPDEIGFNFEGTTNPRASDEPIQDFVIDTSQVTTYIEMTIPLNLKLSNLVKNVGFGLGNGFDFSEVDSLVLRIVTLNEMPFSGLIDIEIYDQNDELAFSTEGHQAFETPFLNTDGSLKQARKHIEDIPISKEGVASLKEGKKLNLKITLNTPTNGSGRDLYVKILADYSLDIQLSAFGIISADIK